jgi:hypothetical protein
MVSEIHPKNFRRITGDSKPSSKIRTADHTTLILIKESGDAMYGRTRADKDQIIGEFQEGSDLLLWAWVGQHHTDFFILDQKDIHSFYK